ncbi:tRNA (N6-threonylcarbamoyladenosine(37)-N6)-methyltransferase TrmO [Idiomarina sp. UBA3162]|jgi:tRNA-Thr(GGU) m(6)t(6)A37 methyltransferase TsaA|uniref:tRNA (N6-threonylcarbamoyladenosine(37)-N6)-methyltransferase TrmO n=1 Tax=Idiomarina sp. UBA3162 TaxID=1946641 RepID=UPI000C8F6A5E|nr:tRNA (N6-threonylcarbamoyladenosine(37)-N6)-methyltransferase TrmO [Idiomarina sp. UBA3162]MAD54879.1 tRNA (N6-threonylcarbamoyladenosine(37)-N6)-methyltransferase TrmO [Idiomarinaceae bacterium]
MTNKPTSQTIAHIHTPFPEKFSVPRQPGLAAHAEGIIKPYGDYDYLAAFSGIEQHSHLWLLFEFHHNAESQWQAQVRPPRLGGNQKVGVFATRSPFRPSNIGLSAVKLLAVNHEPYFHLVVAGADLVDNTPIIDIKPYIPYCDAISDATSSLAPSAPQPSLSVVFSEPASHFMEHNATSYPNLRELISELLGFDVRPAYKKQKADAKIYASRLYDLDIHWQVRDKCVVVEKIVRYCP